MNKRKNNRIFRFGYAMGMILPGMLFWSACRDKQEDIPFGAGEVVLHVSNTRSESDMTDGDGTGNPDSGSSDTLFFAKGAASGQYTEAWAAVAQADGRTEFTTLRYYPDNNSPIYLCGYAPAAPLNGNKLSYRLNGSEDVIASTEHKGSLDNMFWREGKTFAFRHLLTQLSFRIRTERRVAGRYLDSLSVVGVRLQATRPLPDDTLVFGGSSSQQVFYRLNGVRDTLQLADVAEVAVPGALTVEPGVPLSIKLTVMQNGKKVQYGPLPVTFHETGGKALAGTSYLVTITISRKEEVYFSSTVTEWKTGDSGFGSIVK